MGELSGKVLTLGTPRHFWFKDTGQFVAGRQLPPTKKYSALFDAVAWENNPMHDVIQQGGTA